MAKNKWRPSKGQYGVLGGDRKSKAGGGGLIGRMGGPGVDKLRGARKGKGGLFGRKKVQGLQQGLNQNGANPPLKVDGDYGPKTRRAVGEFNQKQEQNIY